MQDHEAEYIKSCGALLHTSTDHAQIIEVLERLQTVSMSIETLKTTRIGAIVNKLTKRSDLPSKIHKFAWELVNNWKEIATASHKMEEHSFQSISNNNNNRNKNRKRSLSTMLSDDDDDDDDNTNTNNNNNNNKRQRMMFSGIAGINKTVPSLQQICIKVMKQNAMQIGKIPCELNGDLVQQIYGSLKPSELKKIYKINPHLRKHLDILWRRQLIHLNPNYVKRDSSMSWFKAYQIYLIERKDKLESAKQRLAAKTEEAKYSNKQSSTRLLSKEEATIFKSKYNTKYKKKYRPNSNQIKKKRMIKDCMDFVQRRNRMFAGAAIKNNKQKQMSFNKKKSFVRRQKELREKRKADKNRICPW